MGKCLVRVRDKESKSVHWGLQSKEGIQVLLENDASLSQVINKLERNEIKFNQIFQAENVEYLSPVTSPCQIICQGKNYLDHMLETGVKPKNKGFNLLFAKASSSLAPALGTVHKPSRVRLFDYECELGLVVRKPITCATNVTRENIYDYVAGLVIANDLSARDIQVPERQWFKGKSFRGFCPVGPWIWLWTKEEVQFLDNLELNLSVNGSVRQKSNTKLLLHTPEATLSEISEIFDLYSGDLLLTGTPGGVAMKVKAKNLWEEFLGIFSGDKEKFSQFISEQEKSSNYLKVGDNIVCSIRSPAGEIDLGQQNFIIQ